MKRKQSKPMPKVQFHDRIVTIVKSVIAPKPDRGEVAAVAK